MRNQEQIVELNSKEIHDINGGGAWQWQEALTAYCLLGIVGVGFYTLGTMQN